MFNKIIFMEIIKKEEELFNKWKEKRERFSADGIIDFTTYKNSKNKILFLMKEVNSEVGFNLKEELNKGGRRATWGPLSAWVYGIINIQNNIHWNEIKELNNNLKRKELLKSICVVNIKKSSGGNVSNNKDLLTIAQEDVVFFNQQLNIYITNPSTTPDLIIGCGSSVSGYFNNNFKISIKKIWKMTKRGIWYFEYLPNKFFISYSHPGARVSPNLLYYGLIDAVREIKEQTHTNNAYK